MGYLSEVDPEVAEAIRLETERQEYTLGLIASENYASEAVMEACASIMTNKYAEGAPHKRYYSGCDYVDIVEDLAVARAKAIFGADYVNVQPHSGSQANMAIYFAVLQPGDTVLAMDLYHGGHLTHGSLVNFSGKFYNFAHYGVSRETELIDFDELASVAKKCRPKLIVAGATAYPRIIDFVKFREIADYVGAYLMVDMAHIAGLVAAGVHPSPIEKAHFVSTSTHKTLRGPRGGMVMCKEEFAPLLSKSVFPGMQGGPLMHEIAAKAVALKEAMSDEFKEYQRQTAKNAAELARELIKNGFRLVSGGTDNHLMLVDLRVKGLTGKDASQALYEAAMVVNKNTIPYDTQSPFITSGIRLGTPAVTTRGMKEPEMRLISELIARVLEDMENRAARAEVREEVKLLCSKFPQYSHRLII